LLVQHSDCGAGGLKESRRSRWWVWAQQDFRKCQAALSGSLPALVAVVTQRLCPTTFEKADR
jgi:hypothetical protein